MLLRSTENRASDDIEDQHKCFCMSHFEIKIFIWWDTTYLVSYYTKTAVMQDTAVWTKTVKQSCTEQHSGDDFCILWEK